MFNNSRQLEIAEYLCLAIAIAGSVVASLSGKVLYVAVPLSALVLLNFINRRRFELWTKQTNNAAIARIHRQLSGELQSLHTSDRALSKLSESIRAKNGQEVEPSEEIEAYWTSLVKRNLNQFERDLGELKEQSASLQDSVRSLFQYLNSSSLSARVDNLEQAIASLSPDMGDISDQLEVSWQNQLNELKQQIQAIKLLTPVSEAGEKGKAADISQLEASLQLEIYELKQQVQEIKLNTITTIQREEATKKPEKQPKEMVQQPEIVYHSPTLPPIGSAASKSRETLPSTTVATPQSTSQPAISEPPPQNWKCQKTLTGHSDWVACVAITEDGKKIASGSFDGKIKIWDLESGELIRLVAEKQGVIYAIALNSKAEIIASGSSDLSVQLWDWNTGAVMETVREHSGSIRSLAISQDGKTLASGSFDQTIKVISLDSGKPISTLTGHLGAVSAIAFCPDGQILASGSGDGNIKIWHWNTGQLLHTISGDIGAIGAIAFHPNGLFLASASTDRTIKLWHLGTLEKIHTFTGHAGAVTAVTFTPDGESLISGSADGTLKIWHLSSYELVSTLNGNSDSSVVSAAISPNGQIIVSGKVNGTIDFWHRGLQNN